MKLSGMFRIGFVAAIVTALILLPSCIAPGNGGVASTSTSQPDPHSGPTEPPRSAFNVREYINRLNAKDITDLPRTTSGNIAQLYGHVPIYRQDLISREIPLYSVDTSVPVVQQALQDYRSVGIVDVRNNEAKLVRLNNGVLVPDVFAGGKSAAIQLFKLDPDLHRLPGLVKASEIPPPRAEDIENLPHVDGKPILTKGSKNFDFMLRVASTYPHKFYYLQEPMEPILVEPTETKQFSNLNPDVKQKIQHAVNGYSAAKQKYGERVASMIWGKPYVLTDDPDGRLKPSIPIKLYPRFRYDAPKKDMVRALQHHGRFRVYKNSGGDKVGYKVFLKNPGSTGELMDVSVEPLTWLERSQERTMALARQVKLP
ncbi:uncharacterized protein UBRO_07319 [Ustilago bromivora]|uniref:Uncharacterized protein n=1 Tax=Ustilago bromivora TaxID=307758 RepID=A0A1K0GWP2_9BASI|nr:uncharacterized protein UBRO_07319 [Ustilago bromivora]